MKMIKIWPWSRIEKLNSDLSFQIDRNQNLTAYNARLEGWHEKEKAKVAAGLRIIANRDLAMADLKTELATALDALRIADERADKNAVACDAAHDSAPPVPKDTRRTKAKTAEKRTATAPGGARLVLKNVEHDNRDSEKAYADAVKESEND